MDQAPDPATVKELVVLDVALALMAQQHNALLFRFHTHLLTLQDLYHSSHRAMRDEYHLSAVAVTAKLPPVTTDDLSVIGYRMARMVEHYKEVANQEIKQFTEDALDALQRFNEAAARSNQDWLAAERRRKDELAAALAFCRREVSATVALMKSQQAQTHTEVSALRELRTALDCAMSDLSKVRADAEIAQTKLERELLDLQRRRDADRAEHHAALVAEREAASAHVKTLIAENDLARRQHLTELADVSARTAETIEATRRDLASAHRQSLEAQRDADECRRSLAVLQKEFSEERLQLQKTIASLEFDNEKYKLLLEAERTETSVANIELRRSIEARKNAEVEEFKRRLMTSVGGASPSSTIAVGRTPRTPRTTDGFSPPSARLSDTPTVMQRGNNGMSSAARSPLDATVPPPSDTFIRLQQMSAAWKERLAAL